MGCVCVFFPTELAAIVFVERGLGVEFRVLDELERLRFERLRDEFELDEFARLRDDRLRDELERLLDEPLRLRFEEDRLRFERERLRFCRCDASRATSSSF